MFENLGLLNSLCAASSCPGECRKSSRQLHGAARDAPQTCQALGPRDDDENLIQIIYIYIYIDIYVYVII